MAYSITINDLFATSTTVTEGDTVRFWIYRDDAGTQETLLFSTRKNTATYEEGDYETTSGLEPLDIPIIFYAGVNYAYIDIVVNIDGSESIGQTETFGALLYDGGTQVASLPNTAVTINDVPPPLPNLTISDVDVGSQDISEGEVVTQTYKPGDVFSVVLDIQNDGAGPAGSSIAAVYLVINGQASVMTVNGTSSLTAGSTDTNETLAFTLPSNLASGRYEILVMTDYSDIVDESNEGDNIQSFFIDVASNSAPTVTILASASYAAGTVLTGSQLFSASDPDGSSDIDYIKVFDNSTTGGAVWKYNGQIITPGGASAGGYQFEYANRDLLTYTVGTGSNDFVFEAFDMAGVDSNDAGHEIAGGSGDVVLGENYLLTAQDIDLVANQFDSTGFIGSSNEQGDFYKFQATDDGTLTIDLTGLSADLDLYLLNSTGTELAKPYKSGATSENIVWEGLNSGETYYIKVAPYNGAQSSYSLAVDFLPDAPVVTGPATAKELFKLAGGKFSTFASFAKAVYDNDSGRKELDSLKKDGWQMLTSEDLNGQVTLENGMYTLLNTAALVARSSNALVISFRGTDDWLDVIEDAFAPGLHYDYLGSLIAAIDATFVGSIDKIYVAGHSLGGALTHSFMSDHPTFGNTTFEAYTFASPGNYRLDKPFSDDRTTNFRNVDDPINIAANLPILYTSKPGDDNVFHFGDASGLNLTLGHEVTQHFMDLYLGVMKYVEKQAALSSILIDWLISSFDNFIVPDDVYDAGNGLKTTSNLAFDALFTNYFNDGIGRDTLVGGGSNEVLLSGSNHDILNGGAGNDLLVGGSGNDIYLFGKGHDNDAIVERQGNGSDTIRLASGVSLKWLEQREDDLVLFTEWDRPLGFSGSGTIVIEDYFKEGEGSSIENIEENGLPELLWDRWLSYKPTPISGDTSGDNLFGYTDTNTAGSTPAIIDGGGGTDLLSFFDTKAQEISVNLTTGIGSVLDQVGDTTDFIVTELENITSSAISASADFIVGSDISNWLRSFGGNDHVEGLGGDDNIEGGHGEGDDYYDGGEGDDTVWYTSTSQGILVNLAALVDHATGVEIDTDQLFNIENIIGGSGNDTIAGNFSVNFLDGGIGDDELSGNEGNDVVFGGSGEDDIFGGVGEDSLFGDSGSDIIYGGADNDTINGGTGNDGLLGESGNDNIFDGLGDDIVLAGADHDSAILLSGINQIEGGTGNDILVGGIQGDVLLGGEGNDLIKGDVGSGTFGGADTITGGTGDDIMMGGVGADVFVFNPNDGRDTIAGGNGSDVNFDPVTGYSLNAMYQDFEVGIDHIQLEGFSSVNSSNVMSFVSSTAQGAVFTAEGTDITIYGVDAASLTVDDFLFV